MSTTQQNKPSNAIPLIEYLMRIHNPEIQQWFSIWREIVKFPCSIHEAQGVHRQTGMLFQTVIAPVLENDTVVLIFSHTEAHRFNMSDFKEEITISVICYNEPFLIAEWKPSLKTSFIITFHKRWLPDGSAPFCFIHLSRNETDIIGPLDISATDDSRFLGNLPKVTHDLFLLLKQKLRPDFDRLRQK